MQSSHKLSAHTEGVHGLRECETHFHHVGRGHPVLHAVQLEPLGLCGTGRGIEATCGTAKTVVAAENQARLGAGRMPYPGRQCVHRAMHTGQHLGPSNHAGGHGLKGQAVEEGLGERQQGRGADEPHEVCCGGGTGGNDGAASNVWAMSFRSPPEKLVVCWWMSEETNRNG